jgi:hypothetical protein
MTTIHQAKLPHNYNSHMRTNLHIGSKTLFDPMWKKCLQTKSQRKACERLVLDLRRYKRKQTWSTAPRDGFDDRGEACQQAHRADYLRNPPKRDERVLHGTPRVGLDCQSHMKPPKSKSANNNRGRNLKLLSL